MANVDLQIVLSAVDNTRRSFGQLDDRLGKLRGRLENMKPAFQKMALLGTAAFAAIGAGVFKATQAASNAQEIFNKFEVVFGDVAAQADAVARNLRDNFGLAESSAKDLLSATGDMLTGFGLSGQAALDLAEKTNTLAVDLASFTNIEGGAERASKALTKALLGERESVKELGIAILEEDVKAKVEAMRISGELTNQTDREARAIATLEIAYSQSKNAIGDFARTSDSLANQQRVLGERVKELNESLGTVFIPILNDIVKAILPVVERVRAWIEQNPELTKKIIIAAAAIAGLVAVAGALGLIVLSVTAGIAALGGALIVAKAILIGIAIGGIVFLATKIKDLIAALFGVETTWRNVWETMKEAFDKVVDFISDRILDVINIIDRLVAKVAGASSAVKNLGSKVAGAAGRAVGTALGLGFLPFADGGIVTQPTLGLVGEAGPEAVIPLNRASGIGGITINVNGGMFLDEGAAEDLGDKLVDVLKRHIRI